MLIAIPKSEGIGNAFRVLIKKIGATRKRVNSQAAKEMKADRYDAAQKWMEVGRSVADFAQRADAFAEEWKRLTKATKLSGAKASAKGISIERKVPKRTPVWKFCVPALKTLAGTDGDVTLDQVRAGVEKQMASMFTKADLVLAKEEPRWHASVARAYRHCQREGWIEKRRDGMWKITPKGKAVAADGVAAAAGSRQV